MLKTKLKIISCQPLPLHWCSSQFAIRLQAICNPGLTWNHSLLIFSHHSVKQIPCPSCLLNLNKYIFKSIFFSQNPYYSITFNLILSQLPILPIWRLKFFHSVFFTFKNLINFDICIYIPVELSPQARN